LQIHRLLRFGITPLGFDRSSLRRLLPVLGAAALALGTSQCADAASDDPRAASGVDSSASKALAALPTVAPLLAGHDGYRFALESRDPRVRRYFDQGMLLAFGFNPEEAARSFEAALAIDPACASCWWALAWALGPTINADMSAPAAARVDRAVAQARRHAQRAAPTRRALIEALALRHPRAGSLDEAAYAKRMRMLAQRLPDDALVSLLAAEALLNLHPYDWWSAHGAPRPWTAEIAALLERAMALDPLLAGAHHYWIHLQESSPHPQRAQPSADFLRSAVPGSGHLLHMPAHIDLRVGRYEAAIEASQRSIEADRRYLAQVDAQGAYRVGYVAHNHHFLWAAASMAGREALALQAALAAWPAACGPTGRDPGSAIVQQYAVLPYFTQLRFGRWAALLHDTPPPDAAQPYPLAMWHYARGTARARSGQIELAQQELAQLQRISADPALAALRMKNLNPAAPLVRIAVLTLQADLALAGGRPAQAVALLREATIIEDGFEYDEPHLWLAPTRHALGAALLAAGQAAQAEQVYRQDLRHYPANGWSLNGLALALSAQGKTQQAAQAAAKARAAFGPGARLPAMSRF
jgi:tetratricopeptide (TPR) repeat protein